MTYGRVELEKVVQLYMYYNEKQALKSIFFIRKDFQTGHDFFFHSVSIHIFKPHHTRFPVHLLGVDPLEV